MTTLALYKDQEVVIVEEGSINEKAFVEMGFSRENPADKVEAPKPASTPKAPKTVVKEDSKAEDTKEPTL